MNTSDNTINKSATKITPDACRGDGCNIKHNCIRHMAYFGKRPHSNNLCYQSYQLQGSLHILALETKPAVMILCRKHRYKKAK